MSIVGIACDREGKVYVATESQVFRIDTQDQGFHVGQWELLPSVPDVEHINQIDTEDQE